MQLAYFHTNLRWVVGTEAEMKLIHILMKCSSFLRFFFVNSLNEIVHKLKSLPHIKKGQRHPTRIKSKISKTITNRI